MGFLDGKRGLVRSYFAMLYQIAFMSKIYEQNVNNKKRISYDTQDCPLLLVWKEGEA